MYFEDIFPRIYHLWPKQFSLANVAKTKTYVEDIANCWDSLDDKISNKAYETKYNEWDAMMLWTMYQALTAFGLQQYLEKQATIFSIEAIPITTFETQFRATLSCEGNEPYLSKYKGFKPESIDEAQIFEKYGKLYDNKSDHLKEHFINHPFYKNEPNYFSQPLWQTAHLANDFFLEPINFAILIEIMNLHQEEYFVLCDAHSYGNIEFGQMPKDIAIKEFRKDLNNNDLWFNDWYLFSSQKNWACVSVYDDDALYIGYFPHPKIDQLIQQNPNFERFLP